MRIKSGKGVSSHSECVAAQLRNKIIKRIVNNEIQHFLNPKVKKRRGQARIWVCPCKRTHKLSNVEPTTCPMCGVTYAG